MNIFIDTSIFIKENFFKGKKLERLAILSNQHHINLMITEIIDNEIIKNLKKQILDVSNAQKKFKRQLETRYRIIKNSFESDELILFNDYYLENSLLEKYSNFKSFARIQIIKPKANFNISKIISDYFDDQPPFEQEKKKEEFPDALSFKILEDYCKDKNEKGIFLTTDNDFSNINSDYIDIKNDINELLEEIIKGAEPELFENETQVKNCINKDIELFKPLIEEELRLDILMHALDIFHKYDEEISFDSKVISEFEIMNIDIFDISEHSIGFKCSGDFQSYLYPKFEGDFNISDNPKILLQENLDLKSTNHFRFVGNYESTFYYTFEFPFEIEKDSIQIEEEKIIREIKSI